MENDFRNAKTIPYSPFARFVAEIGNGYTFVSLATGKILDRWELFAHGYTDANKLKQEKYPVKCHYNPNWHAEWTLFMDVYQFNYRKNHPKTIDK